MKKYPKRIFIKISKVNIFCPNGRFSQYFGNLYILHLVICDLNSIDFKVLKFAVQKWKNLWFSYFVKICFLVFATLDISKSKNVWNHPCFPENLCIRFFCFCYMKPGLWLRKKWQFRFIGKN